MAMFIPDGYTIKATLKPNPELGHEELRFEYRPATGMETDVWTSKTAGAPGEEVAKQNADFIAKHLVSWSIRHNGRAVDITPANCQRLTHKAMRVLCDIISGYALPDVVIEGEPQTSEDEAKGN